jgi:hypothetical protein
MATTNIQSFVGQVEVNSNLSVDTNTLHVDSVAGRVGIGKIDPAYAMDVNGTVNATALYVDGSEFVSGLWTESGSNIYYTGGNVGIGTTDPQKTLEVAGPVRITDGGTNVCDLSANTAIGGSGGGGDWTFQQKIFSPDGEANDLFGLYSCISISSDGSYVIAGAPGDQGPAGEPAYGAAYIFSRSGSTWTYQSKITAPDAESQDRFGANVDISNDGSYAIVGAFLADGPAGTPQPNYGAAYIYVRSGSSWTFQQKLTAPNESSDRKFGETVVISGDGSYAHVAAYRAYTPGPHDAGSVYSFNRTGSSWASQGRFWAPDAGPGADFFGRTMAMSNDDSTLIVGAWNTDRPGQPAFDQAGAAYIYSWSPSGWGFQQKLTAPDAAYQDSFAFSVAISSDGNTALVGALADEGPAGTPQLNYGSAYIFSRSGSSWTFQQKITAPDGAASDGFGSRSAISGDGNNVFVSSTSADGPAGTPQNNYGAVYNFGRSGTSWTFQYKITAPDPAPDNVFGGSVAVTDDGQTLFAGGYPYAIGAVYVYNLESTVLSVSTPIVADGTLLSFTGQHICFPEGPMGQGLVVSANKNKYVSLNGSLTTGTSAIKSSEALPVVSLSNVASDKSVFGVVDHFEQSGTTRSQKSGATVIKQDKESGDNRVVVNSLGEGAIWVANTNGNVVSGDFLTTSHLPGYAQRQEGHIFKSYTVAKSTMDCDFEPEELPVQVILKDDDGNNVLDSHGRLQWVDSDRTEPEYRIRYLDVSGTPTDEANAVHKAAYVGCTYHCG